MDDHPLFPSQAMPPVLMVSGQTYWAVSLDDCRVLSDYHLIVAMGEGSFYVEFRGGTCSKYEYKPGGGARVLNALRGGGRNANQ